MASKIRLQTWLSVICLSALTAAAQSSAPPPGGRSNPETAVISTADVDLFWHAYDLWKNGAHGVPDQLAPILDREYIQRGSPGVQAFIPNRIISAGDLAQTILQDSAYYDEIRANTEKMQTFVPEIRRGFERLREVYPEAIFPPVYFVVGRRNSGGTDTDNGLIIGAEMFAETGSRLHLNDVLAIVIHELIHYQQQARSSDLKTMVMKEGAADFIAEFITGNESDEGIKPYGDSHEEELWEKLQKDVMTNSFHAWLYNAGDEKRVGPPDLGYYVGYKVCQSFYEIAPDKVAALKTIIAMKSPDEILAQSAYAQRFR